MDNLSSPLLAATPIIPGYGLLYQTLARYLGVDPSRLIPIYFILFALYEGSQYFYDRIFHIVTSCLTSCVEIDDLDVLYYSLMDWISAHPMTKGSASLKATSGDTTAHAAQVGHDINEDDFCGDNGLFSYEKWMNKRSIIYNPYEMTQYFWHRGHLFHWTRGIRDGKYSRKDKFFVIRCFSRNTEPIKDLLREIKAFSLVKRIQTTAVYRATTEPNSEQVWSHQSTRSSRPIDTVSLDEQQKIRLIEDANDYLHPLTARWYATRGIPYRRGYLFHGPPGTGKTSLSFSLAGLFGLSIYCVSLGENNLTERALATLFSELPEHCIVLLEDVDAAGLQRDDEENEQPGSDSTAESKSSSTSHSVNDDEKRKEATGSATVVTKQTSRHKSNSDISLAGLLNIIDGAASKEGRLLIMTTNCPESLDSALIRPGRVDQQIKFSLATRDQIRDMFQRMYKTDEDIKTRDVCAGTGSQVSPMAKTHKLGFKIGDTSIGFRIHSSATVTVQTEELKGLAEQFAGKLPEEVFSPAEIQGFLMKRKLDPKIALQDVDEWSRQQLDAKKKGKKVVHGTLSNSANDRSVAQKAAMVGAEKGLIVEEKVVALPVNTKSESTPAE